MSTVVAGGGGRNTGSLAGRRFVNPPSRRAPARSISLVSGSYGPDIREVDDFAQAGDLHRLMNEADVIVARSLGHFRQADPDLGHRLEEAITEIRG